MAVEAKAKPQLKDAKVLVAELTDKRPSGYVLEGSGENGQPVIRLDCPNGRKLKKSSTVMVKQKASDEIWKPRRIRYIQGCPTIFVDEQEAQGYKPNPAHDAIWIEKGAIHATRQGMEAAKFDYLLYYEGNRNFPETDTMKRMDGGIDVYTLIDTEADADILVDNFDERLDAMNILAKLKRKEKGDVVYNEQAIEFLASLFGLPAYPSGFKSEAFMALTAIAQVYPDKFVQTIAAQTAPIEADVNKAVYLGVITIDGARAFFTESKKLILELKERTNEGQINELVTFMANPANSLYNGQMRQGINAQLIANNKKVGSKAPEDPQTPPA